MSGNTMDISSARQARDIHHMARRRMRSESKKSDPCLRIILGHFAVYQYTISVLPYEDILEFSEDEQPQADKSTKEELHETYSNPEGGDADHEDDQDGEEQMLWESACFKEKTHCAPPEYTEVDALRWLLPTDDQTLECGEIEEPEVKTPQYEPPVPDHEPQPVRKRHIFSPLRQHPPTSSALGEDSTQEWRPKIFTMPHVEMQRRIVVSQLADVLLRALNKLGIKKLKKPELEEGPDIEAQIDLQSLAAAFAAETKGQRLSTHRTTTWVL